MKPALRQAVSVGFKLIHLWYQFFAETQQFSFLALYGTIRYWKGSRFSRLKFITLIGSITHSFEVFALYIQCCTGKHPNIWISSFYEVFTYHFRKKAQAKRRISYVQNNRTPQLYVENTLLSFNTKRFFFS